LDPQLREAYAEAERSQNKNAQLKLSLALLPVDPNRFDFLYERVLEADPEDLPVLRDGLRQANQAILVERLRGILAAAGEKRERRFRAACAMTACVPADDACWLPAASLIVQQLLAAVQSNPSQYAALLEQLRPVKDVLLEPAAEVYRNPGRTDAERMFATSLLMEYAADRPSILADLLLDGDAKQFAMLFPRLQAHAGALPLLVAELDRKRPAAARETQAKRQATAAVALFRMNRADLVWPLLRHSPDPTVRSFLIHRLVPMGTDTHVLRERLDQEPDVAIRRALILSLGEDRADSGPDTERNALIARMREIFRTATDPGLHAAAEWWLRQSAGEQDEWLRQTQEAWAKDQAQKERRLQAIRQQAPPKPQWYVTGEGQTMIVIPGPVVFRMGSPPEEVGHSDWERQHWRRIGRSFTLASTSVTMAQFQRFLHANPRQLDEFGGKDHMRDLERFAPVPDCPISGVDWYQAAAYCNWLSEREGIPRDQWCYSTNAAGRPAKKEAYWTLVGYRLPTEAEWEYACRAQTTTTRHYGESDELLQNYAWFLANSGGRSRPVGTLKPNDWGFFDMHGNTLCWCQERMKRFPRGRPTGSRRMRTYRC
jgi:formylglycine-generating enzyme required for sulfatase activity